MLEDRRCKYIKVCHSDWPIIPMRCVEISEEDGKKCFQDRIDRLEKELEKLKSSQKEIP